MSTGPDEAKAAIIDVGSNSVRLVLYRIEGGAMRPFLNEKVMAGLGRGLGVTGRLAPAGVEEALAALRRFRTLLQGLGVERVQAAATAAVREAQDGLEFVARVRSETGLPLRVIEGVEEARLSALGVQAGITDAQGVVGDLGGSSLELAAAPVRPGLCETFPLGPLALMGRDFTLSEAEGRVDVALALSEVLAASRGGRFYAVGGAWRALGRIDMALRGHPVQVLHQHQIPRADLLRLTEFVRSANRKALEKFGEQAAKRAEMLPCAALVLERIVRVGRFEDVVLSSYGLREGLLYEELSAEERRADPLLAGAQAFGAPGAGAAAFGRQLCQWLAPVLEALAPAFSRERDAVLRQAACLMADVGGMLHPEQRRGNIFDFVLHAPYVGVSHPERVFLAAILHHRYTKSAPPVEGQPALALLSAGQRAAAAAIGAGLRFGADLSARSERLLRAFTLRLEGGELRLSADPGFEHLLTAMVLRRRDAFAAALAEQRARV
jgi:exopolyphosphatase/guanosine-5'-triphosphate,3'-diphosphate pyrophosphatase